MISLIVILTVILVSAALAMSLRNLIHSVLVLTLNWIGIGAFFLWAGAEFAAFAQVLVYVGAVSMVILFAVLLTRRSRTEAREFSFSTQSRFSAGMITAGIVCGVLAGVVVSAEFNVRGAENVAPSLPVRVIGERLMSEHVVALLLVGLILTVALIGAVVIAATDRAAVEPPKERRS